MANIWDRTLQTLGLQEKLNPSQPYIARNEGTSIGSDVLSYWQYYENLGVVNRGVNMIVDDASQIDMVVDEETIKQTVKPRSSMAKHAMVDRMLNHEPNPFMDISNFRRLIYTDLLVEGNAFIYFDGLHIYHMPAQYVDIKPDKQNYIKGYEVGGVFYGPDEMIHIKDNSLRGVYRGSSRLKGAARNIVLVSRMIQFQDKFFENGAVPGLVLKSPNALSEKLKTRMIENWLRAYSPNRGGRRPLILDGGLELDQISNVSFKELDFENSITKQENAVLKALGIPPILLDGGNNANIRPNQRLFYIETIIPLVHKVMKALERFFAFKLSPDNDIPGLQPELKEQATFYTTLKNAGIISVNEAREKLNFDKLEGQDELIQPANVAGSAVNPSEGGRPEENTDE